MRLTHRAASAAISIALATGAPLAFGQQQQQKTQPQQASAWTLADIYRDGWSAREMLDTEARGANSEEIGEVQDIIVDAEGRISKVVIETGGFLDIGDEHHGVRWKDVQIGPEMDWVQVPLAEDNVGGFSLFEGEDVAKAASSWRVKELIGDYASLEDAPRYGLVVDVIFDAEGQAQGVVVDRARGAWGAPGRYAFPWAGWTRDRADYRLPQRAAEVGHAQRFDYVELDRLSEHAGAAQERHGQRGAAGGSGQGQ